MAYFYSLQNEAGQEIVAFHWQPSAEHPDPHMHLGVGAQLGRKDIARAHIPTGRISLEEVLRFAITELGANPLREDWEGVLN
jgi:hypothetical protein